MSAARPSTPSDPFAAGPVSALLEAAGAFVAAQGLIAPGDRVLAMVSGGADSALMLHLLAWLRHPEAPAFAGGFALGVCHVNYGRRGAASDGDERLVRELGAALGLSVHCLRAPDRDGGNFQAWARDFRFAAARGLCEEHGYNRIAVGHNRDDRVETMIYRMITYSGRRSLLAMPPRRGRIVRPLLFLDAAAVRRHCRTAGIEYREDASNSRPDYSRNRIRHEVMPRLAALRPDFRERMLDTQAQLEDEEAVLAAVTDEAWRRVAVPAGEAGGGFALRAPELAALERATARLVVRRWLAGSGGAARLSRRLLDGVIGLCLSGGGSRGLSLAGGMRVEREYDKLVVATGGGADVPGPVEAFSEPVSLPVPGSAAFGDWDLEAFDSPRWEVFSADKWRATLDAARLPGSLQVRSWRPGDRFRPLGMTGSKSLQDLFTDARVPRRQRHRLPVVVSGGVIVWVGGLRIAEDFRVTGRSEHLIGLKATRRSVDNQV